jgi:hypothetical protein
MPAVIGKIVPGRTDREGGSAAGSPLRQGRLVRPGAPANPRRAAPVTASRVRFLESNVGGTTEAMLSSHCGTEAYFFVGAGALDGPRENGIPISPALPDSAALRCPKNVAGLRYSLRFSTAAEIPSLLLNALPHLPFPGLFHDGPPTARLRRFRSRFFCHRQRVTGILPPAAQSRNSPCTGEHTRKENPSAPV